ncbi:hypothetical protein C4D60_Mb07t03150 [Musa balbisiana]|uniref:Uncharacterized protein n=1 Tax=Musa balbisiana TaxID=52838 RepID=A0A4S8JCL8_MUSBA|nr:hypothetical protein C4D60_Mb07t03150 [Musa balbisiana]
MAAAEARAAWQRTANRCLVQEDAKRAPKLACCPSSTPQNDLGNGNTAIARDNSVPNLMPLNRNSMNANLSPETKWWLQLQPNFGYQKDFIFEQLSSLEDEVDEDTETMVPTSKLDLESLPIDSNNFALKKEESILEPPSMVSSTVVMRDSETMVKEIKTATSNPQRLPKRKAPVSDYFHKKNELLDMESVDQLSLKSPEKASSDLEAPWTGSNNSEPWWRIADKDELALLIAQKSMQQHIENCDLPKPRETIHVPKNLSSSENMDKCGNFQSSLGRKLSAAVSNANEHSHNTFSFANSDNKNLSSDERGYMLHDSEKLYRQGPITLAFDALFEYVFDLTIICSHTPGYVNNEQHEDNHTSEHDLSRAQLLEALHHSQTRARIAEIAAQKAYDEKEHIVKLLFRQASHLFAYKQWLRVLQLDNIFLQLKIKDHQIATIIPVLPWMPLKGKLSGKCNITRKGSKKHKHHICKYAVAFAVGLGLAGAGLLLGWTIGCLFPTI